MPWRRDLAILAGLAALAIASPAASAEAGLKRTVAIYQFQTTDAAGIAASADALTAMLTDALVRDGRFVVVERADLANIATEQTLGAQASTTAETAAASGRMIGASLIIRGAVTKFEPNAGGSGFSIGGLGGHGFGDNNSVGVKGGHAIIAISIRVIDSATGQVLATVKTQGSADSREVGVSATAHGATMGLSSMKQTPLGKAAEDAIDRAVPQLVLAGDQQPWSAAVIEVADGKVYVSAGADQNLRVGAVLRVSRKVRDLTDPRTGVVLDTVMSDVGTIRIDGVRPRVSTAVVVDGAAPARGDVLKVE